MEADTPELIEVMPFEGPNGSPDLVQISAILTTMENDADNYGEKTFKKRQGRAPISGNLAYGHLYPKFMAQLLGAAGCNAASHVVDIGSGTGSVCFQAAAQFGCTATGIEIRNALQVVANEFAPVYVREMKANSHTSGPVSLFRGNALRAVPEFMAKFRAATIILMNNLTWEPDFNDAVQQLIKTHAQVGTIVIMTNSYPKPKGAKFSGSVVSRLAFPPVMLMSEKDAVSWKAAAVPAYIYTVAQGVPLGTRICGKVCLACGR